MPCWRIPLARPALRRGFEGHLGRWPKNREYSTRQTEIRHVALPPGFQAELHAALFPFAKHAALSDPGDALWTLKWGFAPEERSELAELVKQASEARSDAVSTTAPSDSGASSECLGVQFAEPVDVVFFDPSERTHEHVFQAETAVKAFDGPSGHKAIHSELVQGDDDFCEEVARLLALPRKQVCWSWAW